MVKRRSSRKNRRYTRSPHIRNWTIFLLSTFVLFLGLLAFNEDLRNRAASILTQAAKPGSGGGYDLNAGCAGKTTRPCYDKLASGSVNILGKNGVNTFTACVSNAAPNKVGEIIHKTSVCGQEIVTYCHDGKSNNFIRKFNGDCSTEPPPSPPPTPEPTPTPGPVSDSPFRITYPNGGEQLPFGSYQVVRWEGGDQISDWPVFLSIVDRDRNAAIREMIIDTPNDGGEEWIVDLPIGNYYVYYGQGCRYATCASPSQWDQSDTKFSVIPGAAVEKVNSGFPLNHSLVVLSPSGNEIWDRGSTQSIKWSGKNSTSRINISLVTDTQSYISIARDTENDGVEQWIVPDFVPPGFYKMYVSCANCEAAPSGFTGGNYTYSFYPFTIR